MSIISFSLSFQIIALLELLSAFLIVGLPAFYIVFILLKIRTSVIVTFLIALLIGLLAGKIGFEYILYLSGLFYRSNPNIIGITVPCITLIEIFFICTHIFLFQNTKKKK